MLSSMLRLILPVVGFILALLPLGFDTRDKEERGIKRVTAAGWIFAGLQVLVLAVLFADNCTTWRHSEAVRIRTENQLQKSFAVARMRLHACLVSIVSLGGKVPDSGPCADRWDDDLEPAINAAESALPTDTLLQAEKFEDLARSARLSWRKGAATDAADVKKGEVAACQALSEGDKAFAEVPGGLPIPVKLAADKSVVALCASIGVHVDAPPPFGQ
jgi:hypothetical protein